MPTIMQSAHDRLVREVADSYVRRGYLVEIEPLEEDLPEFLDGFRPDLLARKPGDNIVVEIKSRGKVRQVDYWTRLGNTVKGHMAGAFNWYWTIKGKRNCSELPALSLQAQKSNNGLTRQRVL